MKILVTGSSGFVGQTLIAELKNQKYEVIKFDISKGQNILNQQHLDKTFSKKIDVIIHLAAILENKNPKLWEINVEGTKKLIKTATKNNVKKFIFLSSTGVYGFTKQLVDENTPKNPENLYEKSKVKAEEIVLNHQEEIEVIVLRSAMIFGPSPYWAKMIRVLKRGLPLPTKGKNSFQIIYVKELVNSLIFLIKKGYSGETYLIAGKERPTLKGFCKEIKKVLGMKQKIYTIPPTLAIILGKILKIKLLNRENIRHLSKERKYDTKKIEGIGFKHKYKLEEAIVETIEDIKQMDL